MEKQRKDIGILVVDDREDNLFSIETILEKDNYRITTANSGRAALKILLKQQDFSLILMDVQMPDLNGLETANLIYQREKFRSIPIIFITAQDHNDDFVFKGYEMGGVDYIYKPINPELLRIKVGIFIELFTKNLQLVQHEKKLIEVNNSLQNEIEERKVSENKIRVLNQQLVSKNENLRMINEELERFAYVASHDLQEPLRKIKFFSDKIISNQNSEGEVDRYSRKIIDSSNRMQLLINDLLRFSKHSFQTEDMVETDLNKVIDDVLVELDILIVESGASLEVDRLPSICAIPSMISQLFYNLVSNAIKFRKKDVPLVVRIRTEANVVIEGFPQKEDTVYHSITVSDNGIGFDPVFADDIFKVFKRLHSYHEYHGSGVGLSICKKIVENHNGFISAKGQMGQGSEFTVILPER
ncbi:MAG TPA: response regulator [Chitinophagaceae bacterium]|nr:response regulator [Chitinophagaceae bacterium]